MLTSTTLDVFRDRFPTAPERDYLLGYAGSIRDRQTALQEIEQLGEAIIEDCMSKMKIAYPNIPRFHPNGFDRGYRDNRILLTYAAKCMYFDDMKLLNDQVLTWVRTLFKSFNFTPKFMRDNFLQIRESVRKRTKPRTFALMEPYLNHMMDYMSDIPEPVRPEV
jgi:Phycobilisome protein